MEENGTEAIIKPHKLSRKDHYSSIYIDEGDHTLLKIYKHHLKSTITATNHFMLVVGIKCFEEKHERQIRDLQERVRIHANIIVKYIEKYGKLRVKDRSSHHLARYRPLTRVIKPEPKP